MICKFKNAVLFLIPALVVACSVLPFVSYLDVYEVSEGREGVVVNSMLESSEYILPLRQAELLPSKPPLFHWLSAITAKGRGRFENFELRFVSAFASAFLVFLVGWLLSRFLKPRLLFLSMLTLATTNGFVRMAADGRVDMLLTFLISAALIFWIASVLRLGSISRVEDLTYRIIGFILGFAILAKGPLGIVAPVLVMALFSLTQEGLLGLRSLVRVDLWWAIVISAPWYIAASIRGHGAFLGRQLIFENVSRFSGGDGITPKPIWFYCIEFWPQLFPWSILIVLGGGLYVWASWKGKTTGQHFLREMPVAHRTLLQFSLVWIGALFVFYSASSGKRAAYLLTLLPPISLCLGILLDAFWEYGENCLSNDRMSLFLRKVGQVFLLFSLFGAIFVLVIPEFPRPVLGHSIQTEALGKFLANHRLLFGTLAIILPLISGLFWFIGISRKSLLHLFLAVVCCFEVLLVVYVNIYEGVKGLTHGYREFAYEVKAKVPPSETITFIKQKKDESFDGFFFYFQKTIRLFEPSSSDESHLRPQQAGYYLARKFWLDAQPDSWTREIKRIATGGRQVDPIDKKVVLFYLPQESSNLARHTHLARYSIVPSLNSLLLFTTCKFISGLVFP